MRIFLTITIFFLVTTSFGQLPKKVMKKMGDNPALFLDSTETDMTSLGTLNPFEISNVSIVKPKKAKKFLGEKGSDGAGRISRHKWQQLIDQANSYDLVYSKRGTPCRNSVHRHFT